MPWPGESELREFIRRLKDAETRVSEDARALRELWQRMQTFGEASAGTPAPPPGGYFSISAGRVFTGSGFALSNAVVSFGSTAQASDYGQLQANAQGVYSGSFLVPGPNTVLHYSAAPAATDPAAPRFAPTADATITASPGGTSGQMPDIVVPAAAPYIFTALVYYPLKQALQVADSVNGTFPLDWSAFVGNWNDSPALNYPGRAANGCASAVNNVPCQYIFNGHIIAFNFTISNFTLCPFTSGSLVGDQYGRGLPANSLPLNWSFTATTSNRWYGSQAVTFTLTER